MEETETLDSEDGVDGQRNGHAAGSLDDISDTYHRRRTIEHGEAYRIPVLDIFWFDDYHNKLCVELDVAGEEWVMVLPADGDYSEDDGVVRLVERSPSLDWIALDLEALVGEELELVFNESMDGASFIGEDDTYNLVQADEVPDRPLQSGYRTESVTPSGGESSERDRDFANIERDLVLTQAYYEREDEEWEVTIIDVIPAGDDTFRVVGDTGTVHEIVWELDVPEATDPEASNEARLIERVGGGEPAFIEGETVYAVPRNESKGLRSIATDETGAWVLAIPEDFKDWEPPEQESDGVVRPGDVSDHRNRKATWKVKRDFTAAFFTFVLGVAVSNINVLIPRSSFQSPQRNVQPLFAMMNILGELTMILGLLVFLFGVFRYLTTPVR